MLSKFIFGTITVSSLAFSLLVKPVYAENGPSNGIMAKPVACPATLCSNITAYNCKPEEYSCRQGTQDPSQTVFFSSDFSRRNILIFSKDGSIAQKIPLDPEKVFVMDDYRDEVLQRPGGGYTIVRVERAWQKDTKPGAQQGSMFMDDSLLMVTQIDTYDANLKVISSITPFDSAGKSYLVDPAHVVLTSDGSIQIAGDNGQQLLINPMIDQKVVEDNLLDVNISSIYGDKFLQAYISEKADFAEKIQACGEGKPGKQAKCEAKAQADMISSLDKTAKLIVKNTPHEKDDFRAEFFYNQSLGRYHFIPTAADLYADGKVAYRIPSEKPAFAMLLDGGLTMQGLSLYDDRGGVNQTTAGWLQQNPYMKVTGSASSPEAAFLSPVLKWPHGHF